jgi:hypothetical protein
MANAAVEGSRYIITGAEIDTKGRKRMYGVDRADFSGKPAYQSLANEHIEPAIRIRYQPVTVDGERVGVFEIGDCQDRPYMMRGDSIAEDSTQRPLDRAHACRTIRVPGGYPA